MRQGKIPKLPKAPTMPNIPKCPPVPKKIKAMTFREISNDILKEDKFYNLIKKKVKFNRDRCFENCKFYYSGYRWCQLFETETLSEIGELIIENKRCKQCKTYFGK